MVSLISYNRILWNIYVRFGFILSKIYNLLLHFATDKNDENCILMES